MPGCLLLVNAARNLLCHSFDGLHLVAPSQDTVIKTDRGDRLVQTRSHFSGMNIGLLIIRINMGKLAVLKCLVPVASLEI